MNTNITIEVRRFPVDIRDERTGVVSRDYITLDNSMRPSWSARAARS